MTPAPEALQGNGCPHSFRAEYVSREENRFARDVRQTVFLAGKKETGMPNTSLLMELAGELQLQRDPKTYSRRLITQPIFKDFGITKVNWIGEGKRLSVSTLYRLVGNLNADRVKVLVDPFKLSENPDYADYAVQAAVGAFIDGRLLRIMADGDLPGNILNMTVTDRLGDKSGEERFILWTKHDTGTICISRDFALSKKSEFPYYFKPTGHTGLIPEVLITTLWK